MSIWEKTAPPDIARQIIDIVAQQRGRDYSGVYLPPSPITVREIRDILREHEQRNEARV